MATRLQCQQFADQQDAWLRDTIRSHGWALMQVNGDPSFTYTIGMLGFNHPELVTVGLGNAGCLLNDLGDLVREGRVWRSGERYVHPRAGRPLHFVAVDDASQTLLWAEDAYRLPDAPPISALQVVWSDRRGRLPWEAGYSLPPSAQPLLGAHSPGSVPVLRLSGLAFLDSDDPFE